jgi:hypothetical protein
VRLEITRQPSQIAERAPDILARTTMIVACPGCQRQLNVPEQTAGQHVRCPLCQVVFQAPAAAPAPATAPPPAPAPAPPPYEPAPRAPTGPPQPYADRGPDVPPQDFAFQDDRRGGVSGVRTQYLLNRGAIHLMVSGILFAVMVGVNSILEFVLVGMMRLPVSASAVMAGVILGLFVRLIFVGTVVVFLFIGSSQLRRARGRGLVLTACILAIVLAGLCTIGLVIQLINLTRLDQVYGHSGGGPLFVGVLQMLLMLAGTVYGYIAGIATLTLLGRTDVKEAYGLYMPRRGGPRRDWYDDRRDRYDDRRNRYGEERW